MWLSRRDYERLVKSNDDRDFAAMRSEVERLRSDVRGLRTWLQRNLEGLRDIEADEVADEATPIAVPGGWTQR